MTYAVVIYIQKRSTKHGDVDIVGKNNDEEEAMQHRRPDNMVFLVEARYRKARDGDEDVRAALVGNGDILKAMWTSKISNKKSSLLYPLGVTELEGGRLRNTLGIR